MGHSDTKTREEAVYTLSRLVTGVFVWGCKRGGWVGGCVGVWGGVGGLSSPAYD